VSIYTVPSKFPPISIFNLYRHPNTNIPFSVYSNLIAMASASKYVLLLGDLNAHHHAWGDTRVDRQGELILQACDDNQLIILNDGSPTFIASSGTFESTIDLTIISRELGPSL